MLSIELRFTKCTILVLPEDIPASKHRRVREHHLHLKKIIADSGLEAWPNDTDLILYPLFEDWYRAIFSLILPQYDLNDLDSRDRHAFFITEGLLEEEGVLLNSGLERLMGYETVLTPPPLEEGTSTGDLCLDIITYVASIKEWPTQYLLDNFGVAELAKMIDLYGKMVERSRQEMEESTGKAKPVEQVSQKVIEKPATIAGKAANLIGLFDEDDW